VSSKLSAIEPRASEDRSPGELLREARLAHRLSQKQLAVRAGTTQSAVARIEADRVSPSIRTLTALFQAMEEDFVFGTKPRTWGVDLSLNRKNLEYTATERVERGLGFADAVREIRDQTGRVDNG
jgi:transcriptional regulator with XRE-family HTH domain